MPAGSLAGQNASLVRAVLEGNKGQLVSRWGHILLRRALASRLDAPAGMNPADFAALRAALLVRMGEGEAARALVQDVDAGNYTPALTQAAIDAYVVTADIHRHLPGRAAIQGGARKDAAVAGAARDLRRLPGRWRGGACPARPALGTAGLAARSTCCSPRNTPGPRARRGAR